MCAQFQQTGAISRKSQFAPANQSGCYWNVGVPVLLRWVFITGSLSRRDSNTRYRRALGSTSCLPQRQYPRLKDEGRGGAISGSFTRPGALLAARRGRRHSRTRWRWWKCLFPGEPAPPPHVPSLSRSSRWTRGRGRFRLAPPLTKTVQFCVPVRSPPHPPTTVVVEMDAVVRCRWTAVRRAAVYGSSDLRTSPCSRRTSAARRPPGRWPRPDLHAHTHTHTS